MLSKFHRSGLLPVLFAFVVVFAVACISYCIYLPFHDETRSLTSLWMVSQSQSFMEASVDVRRSSTQSPSIQASFKALEHIRDKKVLIAGVLRDNAHHLTKTLNLIDTIGGLFMEYSVALYENDSEDETPQILANWARNHRNAANIHIVSEKLDVPSAISFGGISEGRFTKLAKFRNRYLDLYKQHAPNVDYVVLIDLDLFDLTIGAFLSNFTPENLARNWSFVGANGIFSVNNKYHDTLALRTATVTDTRILEQKEQVYVIFEPSDPWLPVTSVFGGMAIYKASCVGECRYEADGDCEHVSFNACVRAKPGCNNAFMNPAFVFHYHHAEDVPV